MGDLQFLPQFNHIVLEANIVKSVQSRSKGSL